MEACTAEAMETPAATCLGPFAAMFDRSCAAALAAVIDHEAVTLSAYAAAASALNEQCQAASSEVRCACC